MKGSSSSAYDSIPESFRHHGPSADFITRMLTMEYPKDIYPKYVMKDSSSVKKCRDCCFTLIAIQMFRDPVLPKDVVVLLAKYLWKARDDWSAAASPPQGVKKLKTKDK